VRGKQEVAKKKGKAVNDRRKKKQRKRTVGGKKMGSDLHPDKMERRMWQTTPLPCEGK